MAHTPSGITRTDFIRCVDWIIQQRKTRKVLDASSSASNPEIASGNKQLLEEALEVAGWAPFHFARQEDLPEPWRFYVVDAEQLRNIREQAPELMMGKLPKIFSGANFMVQVTWLPEAESEKSCRDWEHAAAAAAAVQNLILAIEARGMGTYWSSAAPLASARMFEICGIPSEERYLGSIFMGPPLPDDREAHEGFSGKMRSRRTPPSRWTTWVKSKFAK